MNQTNIWLLDKTAVKISITFKKDCLNKQHGIKKGRNKNGCPCCKMNAKNSL